MFQGEDGGARQTHMKEMGRAAWGRTGSLWSCRKYKLFKKKKGNLIILFPVSSVHVLIRITNTFSFNAINTQDGSRFMWQKVYMKCFNYLREP